MNETWKPIRGFKNYEVSDLGRVRSKDRPGKKGRVLKPTIDRWGDGYLYVDLYRPGERKRIRVHVLVAQAFLGPKPRGSHCRHGRKGIRDNSVSNLGYGTASQNLLDRRRDGTAPGRRVRCVELRRTFPSVRQAAETVLGGKHRVTAIRRVCDGNQSAAGGFKWRYAA